MANEIEKEYVRLSSKHKLPRFQEIDAEFEISCLESEKFLLKNILKSIGEKLEFYIDIFGGIVHPDGTSMSSMYEMRFFLDTEKNEMYILFKKMMKFHRQIIEIVLMNNDYEQAKFLNEFVSEWREMKKKLAIYLSKMKDAWEKETSIQEDLGYFG